MSLELVLQVVDDIGQIVTTDFSSQALFEPDSTSSTSVINNRAICSGGQYKFTNLTIIAPPGENTELRLSFNGLSLPIGKSDLELASVFAVEVSVRKCGYGEEWTSDNRCNPCTAGTYIFEAPTSAGTLCQNCPSDLTCYGGGQVASQEGIWRPSSESLSMYKCIYPEACLAGNNTHPSGECAEGHTGILCAECEHDFFKNDISG